MERDAFLDRVRRATATARLPEPPPTLELTQTEYEDPAEEFTRNLTSVDGIAHAPATIEDVVPLVVNIVQDAGATSFLSWDAGELPVPGVIEGLQAAGCDRRPAVVPLANAARRTHQVGYDDVAAGVTGAVAGFASSGSIVLDTGPGRPRMASLIPTLHVALLRRSAIGSSVSVWLAAHPAAAAETSNLVFVTGPSRTGDIEMQLNLGVHGPRTIHVVLVPDG